MLIFTLILFLIITFSNPALFINDEWITANQLHQLDIGHQVVYNEGKYGTFSNGTPSDYFKARNNQLGYTLMLPVLSFPVLKLFGLFGDNFRYVVLLLWATLPVITSIMVQAFYPRQSKPFGIPVLYITLPVVLLLFIANLANYTQFPFTAPDAPKEVAAIVFTQHILLALTAVMIYKIFALLTSDTRFSIFGLVATISCSSYLFWSGNAKDHLLLAFLLSLIIYFMLEFFIQKNTVNGLLAFFTTGIAMWARVEVVLPIFVITAALYMIYIVKNRRNASQTSFLVQLLAPLATIVGAIPYLLNNLYVMGNPFKPTVFAFSRVDVTPASPFNPASPIVDNASATLPVESLNPASVIGQFGTFIASIVHFYLSVDWARLPIDALQVLVLPASGNMGLLPVIPIFVFGVLLIIFLRMKTTSLNAYVVLFLAGISIAVIFSYMYALGIMNNDDGIVPDMRYLSPMYLPLDILGLLMIWKTFEKEDWGIIARNVLGLFLIVAPVVTFSFYLLHPFGDDHNGFVTFFNVLIYGLLAASIPACYLVAKDRADKKVLVTLMILLISLTFTWQMMELFIYAMAKFNGYNFWIPIIGQIYQSVFTVSGI